MPKYLQKKIKDERGTWIPVYGRTPEELEAKLAARREAIELAKEMASNPYVWEYAKTWYNLNTKRLSDSRKSDYAIAINRHICPVIGELHMAEVTEDDIEKVMSRCEELSRSSQDKIVCALRNIFKAGKKAGVVKINPCEDLKAGGDKPKEKPALTDEQVKILLETVKGTPIKGFVMIGLYAGLRREEILGLQWDCVELEGKAPHIRVRRALRWKQNQPEVTEVLKSTAAHRDIPIPPQLVEWLRAEQKRSDSDFVVHNTDDGACSETAYKNYWKFITRRSTGPARRMIKQPDGTTEQETVQKNLGDYAPKSKVRITIDFLVTPHILRHTYATNLVLAGVNIKKVQYLLGHAKVETTLNIYTHLMENRPEDNIKDIQRAFRQPKK